MVCRQRHGTTGELILERGRRPRRAGKGWIITGLIALTLFLAAETAAGLLKRPSVKDPGIWHSARRPPWRSPGPRCTSGTGAPERRQQCATEINGFLSADGHPQGGIAVSCRTEEYEALPERLTANGAVVVQPLPVSVVHGFLNDAGPRLEGLRTAAATDPELTRLLTTPLMLGIAAVAYSGVDVPARYGVDEVTRRLMNMARDMSRFHATVMHPSDPLRIATQAPPDVLREALRGTIPGRIAAQAAHQLRIRAA